TAQAARPRDRGRCRSLRAAPAWDTPQPSGASVQSDRRGRLVPPACAAAAVPHCYPGLPPGGWQAAAAPQVVTERATESRAGPELPPAATKRADVAGRAGAVPVRIAVGP